MFLYLITTSLEIDMEEDQKRIINREFYIYSSFNVSER
jgi:hypothetical protein